MMTQSERYNLRRNLEDTYKGWLNSDHHFQTAFELYLEVLADTDALADTFKEVKDLQERVAKKRTSFQWTILGNVGADVERTRSALHAAWELAENLKRGLDTWEDGDIEDSFRVAALFVHGRLRVAKESVDAARELDDLAVALA